MEKMNVNIIQLCTIFGNYREISPCATYNLFTIPCVKNREGNWRSMGQ
jgi:hypothetical protein